MSLGTTVACITSSYRPRNVYTINHATSHGKYHRKKKRSNASQSSISSIIEDDNAYLYELSSRNCPCQHHRSARLRDEKLPEDHFIDSYIVNTFEASVAPLRGFSAASSSNGDSGINTNSNGSRRSSARGTRAFSLSDSDSDISCNNKEVVTTTVILEHDGCDDKKQRQQQNKPFQISPLNDPSHNWTLIKVSSISSEENQMSSIQEIEEYDSLFSSSLKTSHTSSHKELCSAFGTSIEDFRREPRPKKTIQRVQSWPKTQSDLDPHRFDIVEKFSIDENHLKQLPRIPPPNFLTHSQSAAEFSLHHPAFFRKPEADYEIPPCVRNVILQQLQSPRPPTNRKMIKKLSKTITLPEDPSHPSAFTLCHDHPLFYDLNSKKSRARKSRKVVKIVGTFSFFMTMGIVITVLCFLYWSDTFKPMTMM